jgi:3-oxoacyl-[acyl-carrier-protein] synthase I
MATIDRGVSIIGVGARTPVGLNAPSTAAAVRAGISAMAEHPFMIDMMGESMVVCADPVLPAELAAADRFLELALPSARECLSPLLGKAQTPPRIRVLVALPEDRPGRPERLEGIFAERFATALANDIQVQELKCYASGNAGGLLCMEQALSLINSGDCQLCMVGGVDSYITAETLEWLDSQEQLHSETTIWGFCPGEAAGFCLLAARDVAEALGLSASVELVSAASAMEPNRIKTETVCIGEGLSEAFKKALAFLPYNSRVSHTICDMNGEPYRGNEYGFAMLRSPGKFTDDADFQAPAECWGDVGAASGPLFAILASFAAQKQYSPGPLIFLWTSSEGGLRAAALLQSTNIAMRN